MGKLLLWDLNEQTDYNNPYPRICLLLAQDGTLIQRFSGTDIPGVVKVLSRTEVADYNKSSIKRGRYHCASLDGTGVCIWRPRIEDKGEYWPQQSWEEALQFVGDCIDSDVVDCTAFKECVRQEWPEVGQRFDEYEAIYQELLRGFDAENAEVKTPTM